MGSINIDPIFSLRRDVAIMIIEDGKFYFIKDEFFEVFQDYGLMVNKENGNRRWKILFYKR